MKTPLALDDLLGAVCDPSLVDVRMLNYKKTGRSLEVPSTFGTEHR